MTQSQETARIAFEFNGSQHYIATERYSEENERIKLTEYRPSSRTASTAELADLIMQVNVDPAGVFFE
jgi:hypothetical protein